VSAMHKIRDEADRRLVVEGMDDKWTVIHLMQKHGWTWDGKDSAYPYVHDAKGVEGLLSSIGTEVKSRSRTGFVVDADLSLSNRWDAIRQRLSTCGFDAPAEPEREGTILESGDKRVGLWLMPDNHDSGALEDFLVRLIPRDDTSLTWAKEAARQARDVHKAPFSDVDRRKAEIYTWLAWAREAGASLWNRSYGCHVRA
jgi:hypothetical protein